ncbi:MAG: leucine-rich repeat protein [Bacteroidales bacterium]
MKKFSLLLLWTLLSFSSYAFEMDGNGDTPTPTLTIELTDELRLGKALEDLGYLREDPWSSYYAPIHELIIKGQVYAVDFPEMNKIMELQTLNLSQATIEDNSVPAQSFGFDDPNLFPFGNGSITTVTLPTTITKIENEAFIACGSLSSVNFNELTSLREIGNSAFRECGSLVEVNLPATTVIIGTNAFQNCSSLSAINIASNNPKYVSEDGVLYDRSPRVLTLYPIGKSAENVVVSEGTVAIADYVFSNRYDLQSITLPNSLKTIGVAAFSGCGSLSNIQLGNSLETIGRQAFSNTSIESIQFPSTLKTIETASFAGCRMLKSVVLPSSLLTLESSMFSGCSSLESVDFSAVSSLTELGYHQFKNCSMLKTIDLSSLTKLNMLGEGCFAGCSSLESVITPSSIVAIDYGAFEDCTSLKSFDFKNIQSIGTNAFVNCSSLQSIHVPESLNSIGESVFAGCTAVESITVDNNNWDFEVEDGILYYKANDGRHIVFVPMNNPTENIVLAQEVTEIPNYAFAGNQNIKRITFTGTSMVRIGDFAFTGCSNLESVDYSHTLSNLEYIGESAFEDCTQLKSFNLTGAKSLVDLRGLAFRNCESLESLDFSDTNVKMYAYNVFAGCSNLSELKLNNTYENLANEIVSGCYNLKEILLSGAIGYTWTVNTEAFANSGIENIVIGEGSKVFQGGGEFVLINNSKKLFMVAPAVTGKFEIPEGVTDCEWGAFASNPAIEIIHLPSTYTGGHDAFSSLSKLSAYEVATANANYIASNGLLLNSTGDKLLSLPSMLGVEFSLPSGIKSIGNKSISQNPILEKLILGEDVESLDYYAIHSAAELTSITLGENFKSFSDMCIMECKKLKEITILSKVVPQVYNYTFGWYMGAGITFYVPEDMVDLYKADAAWDVYNVQPIGATSNPEVSSDQFKVYVDNGVVVVETLIEGACMTIYDVNGKVVDSVKLISGRTELNTTLRDGSFILAAITINGESVFVRKLML